MKSVREAWGKTAGYKTKSAALLLALYTLIKAIAPDLLTGKADDITRSTIDIVIITGGLDWVWRNRFAIIEWLKGIIKKKE